MDTKKFSNKILITGIIRKSGNNDLQLRVSTYNWAGFASQGGGVEYYSENTAAVILYYYVPITVMKPRK